MRVEIKQFSELSVFELYEILKLRSEVFVVEQNCPYLDCDDKDQASYHVMVYEEDQLIACARCLPKDISSAGYCSIGRVVSSLKFRRSGAGRYVMEQAIQCCEREFPNERIKISAQSYLKVFYRSFDFEEVGEEYLEDFIPHCAMIRK